MRSSTDISELLIYWSEGKKEAQDELFALVEQELHNLAQAYMKELRPGNTLQTTALINETYIRLVDQSRIEWQNRAHFFGIAATIMRRFLLNYLRDGKALKRHGNRDWRVSLSELPDESAEKSEEILALEDALCLLEKFDERKAKVVELKYYGGLTNEEVAEFLKVSEITVARDWKMAKAWLAREIRN